MDDRGWLLIIFGVGVVVGLAVGTKYLGGQALSVGQCSGACPLSQREQTILQNEDVFEWVDWRGVPRKIVRHRKVKLGE